MVNAGKIILGVIVTLAGIWMLIPSSICGSFVNYCPALWQELWFMLKGIVPVSLVVLGILLIWMETE
ncbi:MAG: hypothetical protein PHU12_02465 [Candidatus Aenigmarchaeota archaeon]|nr:hypothetical protein [Candidatus Aenigmarchaeota archaeon]